MFSQTLMFPKRVHSPQAWRAGPVLARGPGHVQLRDTNALSGRQPPHARGARRAGTYPGSGVDERAVPQKAPDHFHLPRPGGHVQRRLPALRTQSGSVSEPVAGGGEPHSVPLHGAPRRARRLTDPRKCISTHYFSVWKKSFASSPSS